MGNQESSSSRGKHGPPPGVGFNQGPQSPPVSGYNTYSICRRKIQNGETQYTCVDCAMDDDSVLCEQCFRNSRHTQHRFESYVTQFDDESFCDCGDAQTSWKAFPLCDIHIRGVQFSNPLALGQPYMHIIQGGFTPGKIGHITGTFTPTATSLIIKLQSGPSGDPTDEIGLCLYGRLSDSIIGCNAFTRARGWGQEMAISSPGMIHSRGQPFEITILCEPTKFKIALNRSHLTEFAHQTNPSSLSHLNVGSGSADITLASVWIEDSVPVAAGPPPPQPPPYGAPPPGAPYGPPPPGPPYGGPPSGAPPSYAPGAPPSYAPPPYMG